MAPLHVSPGMNLNEGDNNNNSTPRTCATEDYGSTDEHEQSSLISALTTHGEDEDEHSLAATTTVEASTYVSNASSTSHYFKQHYQQQKQSGHNHSDSLDYSTTSSTNSILPPSINTNEELLPTRSYLGSIMGSLGQQQSFPSSMFPGQKLISPVNSRETIQVQDGHLEHTPINSRNPSPSSRNYPSYYYFPSTSSYRDSMSSTGSTSSTSSPHHHSAPVSYQNVSVSKNVYQKRRKPGFCLDNDDFEVEIDDRSRLAASWRKCWRCFFSPRVLLTLLVCGVIVFNLLRMGEHHHWPTTTTTTSTTTTNKHSGVRGNTRSSSRSSSSVSDIDADYVKLEVIGGSSNESSSSVFSNP